MSNASQALFREAKERLRFDIGNPLYLRLCIFLMEYEGNQEAFKQFQDALVAADVVRGKDNQIRALEKEYRDRIDALRRDAEKAQNLCPHPMVNWEPDPSGNNDSSEVCLCCGKEV